MSLSQIILDHGLRPPQAHNADYLGPKWFSNLVSLPNAATTAIDLKDSTVIDTDQSIAGRFDSLQSNPDYYAHVEAVELNIFGGAWAALALTEKQKVLEGAYLYCKQEGIVVQESLAPAISEAYNEQFVSFDSDATAAEVVRGNVKGGPMFLARPLTLNLAQDPWEIRFSTATPAGPIKAHFKWFGIFAPHAIGISKELKILAGNKARQMACAAGGRVNANQAAWFDQRSGMLGARVLGMGKTL